MKDIRAGFSRIINRAIELIISPDNWKKVLLFGLFVLRKIMTRDFDCLIEKPNRRICNYFFLFAGEIKSQILPVVLIIERRICALLISRKQSILTIIFSPVRIKKRERFGEVFLVLFDCEKIYFCDFVRTDNLHQKPTFLVAFVSTQFHIFICVISLPINPIT